MKKILFTLFLISSSIILNAQIGVTIGGNLAKYLYTSDRKAIMSFNFGLVYKAPIAKSVAWQPELLYTSKGAQVYQPTPIGNTDPVMKYKNHLNYIELNSPFVYTGEVTDELDFNFGFGPFVSYLTSAKNIAKNWDETTTKKDFAIGNSITDDFKALDYGGSLMAGFTMSKQLGFHFKYELGLANLSPQPNFPALKTRNFSFNITAFFGGK